MKSEKGISWMIMTRDHTPNILKDSVKGEIMTNMPIVFTEAKFT